MAAESIIIGAADGQLIRQLSQMSNRHGLITGATGTGKTVTLQVLAEGFAHIGVPVFAVDVKGDLSGIAMEGRPHPKIEERLKKMPGLTYRRQGVPTLFWDIEGLHGHPVRTTISEMGPLLLSNLLELNDAQSGVLYAGFDIADKQGLLLLDLKDLRALLTWMADETAQLGKTYGNISRGSIGAIQRKLMVLEEQGADRFFGEPALCLPDLMQTDFSGQGVVSLFHAQHLLQQAPRVYAAFLLWLLAELYEQLTEVGDPDRPRIVLFFDEAHLLFEDAPKPLLNKIEQVVRLIRSKGVGVYFVTQSPLDIPDDVLGQLGLKIQHALRAFTPKERKTIRGVADSFRPNPAFDTAERVTTLGIGQALVSLLDADGSPTQVEHVLIAPPQSSIGPLSPQERTARKERSPLKDKYDQSVDRESAYEELTRRAAARQPAQTARSAKQTNSDSWWGQNAGHTKRQSVAEAVVKSAARSIGSQLGRQLIRGVLGSLFGKR